MRPTFALVLAIAGCGVDLPAPAPDSVLPAYGYNGADTSVAISGKHFYPQVEVDASQRGLADVDDGFRATLERAGDSYALNGVELLNYDKLAAVVPPGIPPGTWDLVVTSPTGASGRLPGAFEVTDSLADHLRLTPDEVSFEVFETAWVEVDLVDPAGEPVYDALDVVVEAWAVDEDGGEDRELGVTFAEGSLVGQVASEGGIRGRLANDGTARIGLAVSTPDLVVLAVSPQNARSGIAEDLVVLRWLPGPPDHVEISLPVEPLMTVVAGEPFAVGLRVVDVSGNIVEDPERVLLRDACATGWFSEPITVVGAAVLDVALTRVPPESCAENRLVNALGEGESTVIEVVPAALHHFEVDIGPGIVVTAGGDLPAEVVPTDAYGNPRSYSGGILEVDDTLGGVTSHVCNRFEDKFFCQARPVVAGEDLKLRVVGEGDILGESANTFDVVAGAPVELAVEVAADPVTAGAAVTVTVPLTDAWGNVVDGSTIPSSSYLFADDAGPVSCALSGLSAAGAAEFACILTAAAAVTSLEVSVPDYGLLGESALFTVVNGPLESVEITPTTYVVTAGQALSLKFDGYDAWGNPYAEKADPTLLISDTGGTLSLTTVNLAGAGTATATGTFTLATPTAVIASQGGVELGRSTAISVKAGAADALEVEIAEPWAWVGEATGVTVQAVDGFGNAADLDAVATVTARSGKAATAVAALTDGLGTTSMTWSAVDAGEVLDASAAGLVGSSEAFLVLQDCGASGPVADVTFGGLDEAVACYDEMAGEAVFVASMAGSTGAVSAYRVAVEGQPTAVATSPTLALSADTVGRLDVRALAMDASLCGSEVTTSAWIGLDDGGAVGPLALSSPVSEIAAGAGRATIEITGATTCTGDPAAGALVSVRSDRGEITGAAATGAGLAVTLDATGSGSCTLDATAVKAGGLATVGAGVGVGEAWGELQLDITGDSARPTVWEQDPRGETSGSVSEVKLTFSEPLGAAYVVVSNFSVTGPEPATIASATLSPAGDEVTLALASPIDAGLGTWTVTAVSSASGAAVRDEAGNRLDGAWAGMASTYTGTFGAVAPSVDAITACAASRTAFRPDGDPGVGREADTVDVALTSASMPVWWVISVTSADGEAALREYVVPISASDTWSWGGRDVEERVVDDGLWTITVDSDDGTGNRGGSCTTTVSVDNGSGG